MDLGSIGASASIVAVGKQSLPGVQLPFGELLISDILASDVAVGIHEIAIPDECGLVGTALFSQAIIVTLVPVQLQLLNAVDFTIGTY